MKKAALKELIIFVCLTFLLMYGTHALIALLINTNQFVFDDAPIQLLSVLGGGAPAFSALFIIFRYYDQSQQKRFWASVYRLRVYFLWWLFIFLAPWSVLFLTNLFYSQSLGFIDLSMSDIIGFPLLFLGMIIAGGAEELGWRGIMQKKMETHVNLVYIGLIIGVLWGVWHLPLFLIDSFAHYDYNFFIYLLSTVLFSLLISGLVFKTGSVGLAILFHAAINAFSNLGFGIPMILNFVIILSLTILILISILWLIYLQKDPQEA